MSRIYIFILWAIAILVLISVVSVSFQKCSETSKQRLENVKDGASRVADETKEVMTETNEEFFSDDTEEEYSDLADELFDDEPIIEEEPPTPARQTTAAKPTPTPTRTKPKLKPKQTYSSSSGRYMVVAGSFLVESNAGSMVRKLQNMGYKAESVIFDDSEYYTVLASRSDDYDKALTVSSQLKSRGIDNYVKSQKF